MDNTDVKQPVILTYPEARRQRKKVAAGRVHTIGYGLVARLQPFRFAMVLGLQRRGINTTNLPFRTVIGLYYNNFCVNRFGVAPIDIVQWNNNISFKINENTETGSQLSEARNMKAFTDVAEVADYIIECFKDAKEKYRTALMQGYNPKEVMTDENYTQAKACIKVERELNSKEKSDSYVKLSSVKGLIKWLIWFALIYYIISHI